MDDLEAENEIDMDCSILEGIWKDGKLHGYGRIIDCDGNCYIGMVENGQR